MKKTKLVLWTAALVLLEMFCTVHVRIFGAVPALTFAFLICVAVCDDGFYTAAGIGALCGIAAGSLFGRGFGFVFIFYTLCAAAVFFLRKKSRYTHGAVKAAFWCGVLTAVMETALFVPEMQSAGAAALYTAALPSMLCNAAAAALIYPLIMKTVYNKEKQRKLIT